MLFFSISYITGGMGCLNMMDFTCAVQNCDCLFSVGEKQPYPELSSNDAKIKIKAGEKMERPEDCPPELWVLRLSSWSYSLAEWAVWNDSSYYFSYIRFILDGTCDSDDTYFVPNTAVSVLPIL